MGKAFSSVMSTLTAFRAVDQEELQVAMALSASLNPKTTSTDHCTIGSAKKRGKANKSDIPPPKLITVTAAESSQRLAQRASEMVLQAQVSHS